MKNLITYTRKLSFILFIFISSFEAYSGELFSFICHPNGEMARMVRQETGKNPFSFPLDIQGGVASIKLGEDTFKFEFEPEENSQKSANYVMSNGVSVRIFYENMVAVVRNKKSVITVGQCVQRRKE